MGTVNGVVNGPRNELKGLVKTQVARLIRRAAECLGEKHTPIGVLGESGGRFRIHSIVVLRFDCSTVSYVMYADTVHCFFICHAVFLYFYSPVNEALVCGTICYFKSRLVLSISKPGGFHIIFKNTAQTLYCCSGHT